MTTPQPPPATLANAVPAFSLVRGGPMYRVARALHMISGDGHVRRLALVLVGVTWIPLIVLSALARAASGQWPPLAADTGVHVRLVLAVPLLLVAEGRMHLRTERCLDRFVSGRWAPEGDAEVRRIVAVADRWRDAWWPELAILALALAGSQLVAWGVLEQLGLHRGPHARQWSEALWWYAMIALPVYQFLLYRWLWRWLLWVWMLWALSRLNVRPIAIHPDRAGGIDFLAEPSVGFSWVILASSAVQAGVWADRIIHRGATVSSFISAIALLIVIAVVVSLGPLCVFSYTMWRARFRAVREYGQLAADHSRLFDARWIERGEREQLLGSADIQAQSDLGSVFETMSSMRIVPFGVRALVIVVLAVIVPMIPLALLELPLIELVRKLLSIALGGAPA
jgi:hypothetical protein